MQEKERSRQHLEDLLQTEKEKSSLVNEEWDKIREARELNDKKLQKLQDKLHHEQDEWFKREQELIQRIEEVSEKNQKILQQERVMDIFELKWFHTLSFLYLSSHSYK